MTEEKVYEYVTATFGEDHAKKLRNIRTGGDNNQKGSQYEKNFAVKKICEIYYGQSPIEKVFLSSQTDGFVDDLTIEYRDCFVKRNFQAKNASSGSAKWNSEHQERFGMQVSIDQNCLGFTKSYQHLVVSCRKTAESNANLIPSEYRGVYFSDYFTGVKKSIALLQDDIDLKKSLKQMCTNDNFNTLDTAFTYLSAAWDKEDKPRSVADILGVAKLMSKPDIFRDAIQENLEIPEWLHQLCSFHNVSVHVEYRRYVFEFNGFESTFSQLGQPSDADIISFKGSLPTFVKWIMCFTAKELTG